MATARPSTSFTRGATPLTGSSAVGPSAPPIRSPSESLARLIKREFDRIDKRLNGVETRLDLETARIEKLEYHVSKLRDEVTELRVVTAGEIRDIRKRVGELEERAA